MNKEVELDELDEAKEDDYDSEDKEKKFKRLTNWENEPSVKSLKEDYNGALSSHTAHVTNVMGWLDNLNGVGSAQPANGTNRSNVVPKLIRKQAEWRYAALSEPFLSTEDLFTATPVSWEDRESAQQNEIVLNNQFSYQIDKVNFIDEYVRTAVDEGTVVVRVGWDYQTEDPMEDKTEVEEESLYKDSVEDPEEVDPIIKVNKPTLEVCDYNNVVIDPTCFGNLDDAQFVIYTFETSISALKKEGDKYTNLDYINIDNASPLANPDHYSNYQNSAFAFADKARKKFVAIEYWGFWDIHNNGTVEPIVATFVGDTMIRLEENPFPDKKVPFVIARLLPVRKAIYGEPDGALIEDNQKIIGAVTRGMIDIMGRNANGQIGFRKDALDLLNKRKFERGEDYEFNTTVDPRAAFYTHTFAEIPQSAQYMLNEQRNEAESLTGVKAFSSGITGTSLGNTATGVRSALDAASKRELGILRRLAEGIKQIGRKIIAMNTEFLSDEEVIRVTNEEFVNIRRDDLGGKYDLRLSISTAEADNDKAQELAFMLQTMGNSMDPEMSKMILSDIAKLRKMPDLAKKIEDYTPQPDPIAQEKAQLENELLKVQIENERAKSQKELSTAELNLAKADSEDSKAGHLDVQTREKSISNSRKESGFEDMKEQSQKEFDKQSQVDLKAMDLMRKNNPNASPQGQVNPSL